MTDLEFDAYEDAWAAMRLTTEIVLGHVRNASSREDTAELEAWSRVALNIARTLDILKEHPK